jgi:hypothetical protein
MFLLRRQPDRRIVMVMKHKEVLRIVDNSYQKYENSENSNMVWKLEYGQRTHP